MILSRLLKHPLCFLLLISLCFCSCSFPDSLSADECKVTYSARLIDNDSVGNEWTTYLIYKGEPLANNEIVPYSSRITLYAYAREYDEGKSDSKKAMTEFVNLAPGEKATKTITVVVKENGGRYKGNTAVWEFTITVKRGK